MSKKVQLNPSLIITPSFQNQIDFLHSKIKGTEFLGILVYTVEGDVDNLEELEFTPTYIYPISIGSTTFVEKRNPAKEKEHLKSLFGDPFDFDAENPMDNSFLGLIHTHHSMGTTFSSTDMDELKENYKLFDWGYLSLIVNFFQDYSAKYSFNETTSLSISEVEVVKSITGFDGEARIKAAQRKYDPVNNQITVDVDVILDWEDGIDTWLKEKVVELQKPKVINNTYNRTPVNNFYNTTGYNIPATTKTSSTVKRYGALISTSVTGFLLTKSKTFLSFVQNARNCLGEAIIDPSVLTNNISFTDLTNSINETSLLFLEELLTTNIFNILYVEITEAYDNSQVQAYEDEMIVAFLDLLSSLSKSVLIQSDEKKKLLETASNEAINLFKANQTNG